MLNAASTLASIHVYPVKSCRGISAPRWELDRFGLRYDRAWMVVGEDGRFLTQRELPRLALVETAIDERADAAHLALAAPGLPDLILPLDSSARGADDSAPRPAGGPGGEVQVSVWRHRGPALDAGREAAEWLTRHLGVRAHLVRIPASHRREVNPEWAGDTGFHTAFSDGYPLLLLSRASLADLNRRLGAALPMDRFRPNLVVEGCAPYAEDLWKRARVGTIELAVVKPCSRCAITTTDQSTGVRDEVEPLRTLATYRRSELGVVFGQNCVHLGTGEIAAGAAVEVLSSRERLRETPGLE